MPYIKPWEREDFADGLTLLNPTTPGQLNYLFTSIAANYLDVQPLSYQAFNDVIGALEGAKLELYRRRVAPYEDRQIELNGDV